MFARIFAAAAVLSISILTAQTGMTNDELIKLTKAGLTEDFVVNMVEKEPQKLNADVSELIRLKQAGVSDRILTAVARKAPAREPLTTPGLVQLVKAGVGNALVLELVESKDARFSTDPVRMAELKQAGLSEQVIVAMMKKSSSADPLNADGVVQLVRAGFSETFLLDLIAKQPAQLKVTTAQIIDLKQAGVSERVLSALVDRGAAIQIPAGTAITVRMIDAIDSEKNSEGEKFKASLDEPLVINGETVAPKGADALVTLASEKSSGKLSGRAELLVQLSSVTVRGQALNVESTTVSEVSGSRGARTAKTAGVMAGVGAAIGAIAGGGKGAAIGAGAGAAAGAGSQIFMKGQKVKIPSETVLKFTIENAVEAK
jgi:hypothetical protein